MKALLPFDSLVKWSAVLGASAYAAGFVVVNFHLSRHGFEWLGFFQQHYLAASVWGLLPVVIGSVLISVVFIMQSERPSVGVAIAVALTAILLFAAPLVYLAAVLRVRLTPWWLGFIVVSAIMTFVTKLHVDDLRAHLVEERYDRIAAGYNGLVLLLLFVIGYFVLFSWLVFPTIPAIAGGGSPSKVQLILDDALSELQNRQTDVFDLFVATNELILVRDVDGRPIVLDRGSVGAVIFLPPKIADAQPGAAGDAPQAARP